MLGKLIKHEFRATGRVLLPALAALLVLAVMAGVSIKSLEMSGVPELLEIVFVLILICFVIGIIAVWVMTAWLMISRFYNNLLGEEGYLMFTLPASVHSHIWAKLIVSLLWFLLVGIAVTLIISGLVISLTVSDFAQFVQGFPEFKEVWQLILKVFDYNHGMIILSAIETLAVVIVGATAACLQFYAAMAIGQSFANRKLLCMVIAYAVLSILASFVTSGVGMSLELATSDRDMLGVIMHATLAANLAICAVYYLITAQLLKKKLNLA